MFTFTVTVGQLLAHAVGDYGLQSDWMAADKTSKWQPALAHAFTYTLPFLFLTRCWWALLLIMGSHYVIDRYRLIRYYIWLKNFISPKVVPKEVLKFNPDGSLASSSITYVRYYSWEQCSKTGMYTGKPDWLAVWLMIITDNLAHILCNGLILSVAQFVA